MKTFFDLEETDKVGLTDEQIDYYTRLECANRGIVIPQKPINDLQNIEPPTNKYYQVGYESFVFATEKEAQDFIDIKSKSLQVKSVGSSYNDKNRYVDSNSNDYKEIKSIILYSKEEATNLKSILEYNAETQKEWDNYNNALSEFNDIRYSIINEISEIKFKTSRQLFYFKVFSDYVELANGDKETAMKFFEKAYKNANLTELDREIVNTEFFNTSTED